VATTLSFVAHPDDDLLFMNPDIASDVRAGSAVWIAYLTAGNLDPEGPLGLPYGRQRLDGVRAAWARAADRPNNWDSDILTIGGREVETSILQGGNVQIVCTFISAANGSDNGDLWRMWHDPTFVANPIDGRGSYTKPDYVTTLQELIKKVKPDFMRILDSNGVQTDDHIDHIASAHFAITANLNTQGKIVRRVDEYFGYVIQYMNENWRNSWWATEKLQIWRTYKPFDFAFDNSPDSWDNIATRQHRRHVYWPADSWTELMDF
jgi:LmbE family N-acetylglucosaminyl deacetylase